MGYKPAVAPYGSWGVTDFVANFDYATIDKTLFYVICNFEGIVSLPIKSNQIPGS
jgi:hypothetical protein